MPSGIYNRKPRTIEHRNNISLAKRGKPNGLLGKKYSEKHRKNISLSLKGHKSYPHVYNQELNKQRSEKLKGVNTWSRGKTLSIETRQKMSGARKKEKAWNWKGGKPLCSCGKQLSTYMSKQCNSCIREFNKGKNHWNWQGGITPKNMKVRNSLEYGLWRKAVFERDNYQCIWGGKEHGSKLQADHIKPFAQYPALRFAIDNGRTLCKLCHLKTDTWENRTKRIIS